MPDGGSFLHGMFFEPADMERPLKMPLLCHYVNPFLSHVGMT